MCVCLFVVFKFQDVSEAQESVLFFMYLFFLLLFPNCF